MSAFLVPAVSNISLLSLNGKRLSLEQMHQLPMRQKEKVKEVINSVMQKHAAVFKGMTGRLHFEITGGIFLLKNRAGKILVKENASSYCLNGDFLQKFSSYVDLQRQEKDFLGKKQAEKIGRQQLVFFEKKEPKTFYDSLPSSSAISSPLGVARNLMIASSFFAPDHTAVRFLGVLGGFLSMVSGAKMIKRAYDNFEWAKFIKDVEEKRIEQAFGATGLLLFSAGYTYSMDKLGSVLVNGATPFAPFVAPLYIATSFFAMTSGVLGLKKVQSFEREMEDFLQNPHLKKEEKYGGFLSYLRDSFVVTQEELQEIREDIIREKPNMNAKAYLQLIEKQTGHLLLKKKILLERKMGKELVKEIGENYETLFSEFKNPTTRKQALEKMEHLCTKIQHALFEKKISYALYIIAGALGVVASIAFIAMTSPVLPAVMMALSSFAWICIESHLLFSAIRSIIWPIHQSLYSEVKENNVVTSHLIKI